MFVIFVLPSVPLISGFCYQWVLLSVFWFLRVLRVCLCMQLSTFAIHFVCSWTNTRMESPAVLLLWLALVWLKKLWVYLKGFWFMEEKCKTQVRWKMNTYSQNRFKFFPFFDASGWSFLCVSSRNQSKRTQLYMILQFFRIGGEKCIKTQVMLSHSERPYCWLRKNTLAFLHYHISSYQFVLDWKGDTKNLFLCFTWNFKSNCMIRLQSA